MIPLDFYKEPDPVKIAKDLIGTHLFTKIDGEITGGMIVESEAYGGVTDRASHAYGDRRTKRTEPMYASGGIAYVYLCYGMYPLLNVVTNIEGIPHAVLIRAIKPLVGIDVMEKRRKMRKPLADGPGKLNAALGITLEHNWQSFQSDTLWIEKRKGLVGKIKASPRIGIDYAKEDAFLPWRFSI